MLYDAVRMEVPEGAEAAPVTPGTRLAEMRVSPVWLKENGKAVQPIQLSLQHIGEPVEVSVQSGAGKLGRCAADHSRIPYRV